MLFNSKRHFFCHWTFSFLSLSLAHLWLATSTAPVSCGCWSRETEQQRNENNERAKKKNIILRVKVAFGRWSVDRLQHAGHYNWHTRCKWYTRKWYTSFDCFSLFNSQFIFVNKNNNKWNEAWMKMCFLMSSSMAPTSNNNFFSHSTNAGKSKLLTTNGEKYFFFRQRRFKIVYKYIYKMLDLLTF